MIRANQLVGGESKGKTHSAGVCVNAAYIFNDLPWILDSGATSHFISDYQLLRNLQKLEEVCNVSLPNGQMIPVNYMENYVLSDRITLKDVLSVPFSKINLLSISERAMDIMCYVLFTNLGCLIQDPRSKSTLKTGKLKDGLYSLTRSVGSSFGQIRSDGNVLVESANVLDTKTINVGSFGLWHDRMGHMSESSMTRLLSPYVSFNGMNEWKCSFVP